MTTSPGTPNRTLESFAERVVVVLVEPQQPGNVGAAARAMKNMGLARLVIVAPAGFDPQRARWMAPGCDDVIANMRIVGSLDDALRGVTRAVAATARHRRHDQPVLEPDELASQLFDDPGVVAILFGREDHGLPADAVVRCEALLRIPTPEHASLNLAQAVLLVCHAIFAEARRQGAVPSGRRVGGSRGSKTTRSLERDEPRADVPILDPVAQEIAEILDLVGYPGTAKATVTIRGALQRAAMTTREVGALRGILRRVRGSIERD